MENKIIIFGGTGFIGNYLVNFLMKNKNNLIFAVHHTRKSETNRRNVKYYKTDLAEKNNDLAEIIKKNDPEYAVILTQPDKNVIKNIVASLKKAGRLKKIVYASTMVVYSDSKKRVTEKSALKPVSAYEKDKLSEENVIQDFANENNINLCIARLANVYGGIKNRGIIGIIFNSLFKDTQFHINGDGGQKRDYIFVEDAANALGRLIFHHQPKQKEIFNICSGQGHTINEIITLIKKTAKKNVDYINKPAVKEKTLLVGDNQKMIRELKLKRITPLETGIKKTYLKYLKKI